MSLILFVHFFKVERVASMLNYFLLQLVGPQRKSLSLKDPEKYEFRPKDLLKQVGINYISELLKLIIFFMVNNYERKGNMLFSAPILG